MKCCSQNFKAKSLDLIPCDREATEKIWCASWINSINGPQCFCAEHAENFQSKFNKNMKPEDDKKFFWKNDAEVAYMQAMKEGGVLLDGHGGWDVTKHAFGGDFFRAKGDTKITNLSPHPSRHGFLYGEMITESGTRKVCVPKDYVKLKDQFYFGK
jgi:hypothetical protein